MIEVIVGIAMSIITQIAKKTEIDAKIIILVLSVIFGTVFYFMKESYPEFIDNAWKGILWAYGFSQIVYNYWIQLREKREK